MSAVAVNDAGDVLLLQDGQWQPAPVAQNGRGDRVYFDGRDWRPVPSTGPSAGMRAIQGAGEAVAGAAGAVADVPGSWWGRRARDVIEGISGFPSAAAEAIVPGIAAQRAMMPRDIQRRFAPTLSDVATGAADVLGLARPQTDEERMTSAVVQGVVGAVPTMGVGAAPGAFNRGVNILSQAAGGGLGGAAAETAAQAGYGPTGQILAGMAGGLGGAAAVQGGAAGLRALGAAGQPFRQAGRDSIAAEALLRASSDPDNLRARINAGLADPNARLPGSPATTAQAARDPGLLAVESSIREGALGVDAAIPLRDAAFARNEAQRRAIAEMGDGRTPAERGVAVRRALTGSGTEAADDIGAQQALAARVRQMYDRVDQGGSVRVATAPILDSARGVVRQLFNPEIGGEAPPAALQSVIDDIANAGDSVSWQFTQNIRSRLGEIAGRARASGENRLASAAGAIREAIDQNAMSPRWQAANVARREMGELLGRDAAGTNATGAILRTDRFGNPMMPDDTVARTAIRTPAAVNQVMEAQYRALADGRRARLPPDQMQVLRDRVIEARNAMRGQFIDELLSEIQTNTTRVNSAGQAGRPLSAAWFSEFWDRRSPVAEVLFERPQLRRLRLIANDFAEASIGANAGRTAGSQTVQNMTVGAMIARVSNGLLDPDTAFGQTALRPLRWLYQQPEDATRLVLAQAMADPRFAANLLARATPATLQRAADYVEQNMIARLRAAAGTAAFRQTVRTSGEEERRRAQ
jgi:hypothetical protein